MTPSTTSTMPGTDPRVLLQMLFQQISDNSVNFSQLLSANAIAGLVNNYRVVQRRLAVDVASGQWGTPDWGQYGELSSEEGTTSLQVLGFFMARSGHSSDGRYEVQLLVKGNWFSAASLLDGAPAVPNTIPGVPQIYMPGPPITVFAFSVFAETPQAPIYQVVPFNPSAPVGSAIEGFTNAYHNVGGPSFEVNGMMDPTGQYKLESMSPMYNNWSKMIWVKT